MCESCGRSTAIHVTPASRRHFLKLAGTAVASLATPSIAYAQKSKSKAPPKPANVLSPDGAFDRLMAGNGRYVAGASKRHDFKTERETLTMGQNPYAAILSCADSRIAPEYAFDSARGDLFVCRVAGNFANDDVIASMEYAVAVLGAPMILVLGHDSCGAVDATIKSLKDDKPPPGHLPSLVNALAASVKASAAQPGAKLANAIRRNA